MDGAGGLKEMIGEGLAMRARAITIAAVLLPIVVNGLVTTSAYAGHETRAEMIQETGVNVVLIALVMAAAVLVLALFAAVILWWERQDQDADNISGQQTHGHSEADS
jgi:multisubunit Na+/H+ antiporter MnhC subunit